MARQARIEFQGAIYHVMSRGQHKQSIFIDQRDYEAFRDYVKDMVGLFNIECYGFCLMPNHYHLFFSTPEANLSTAMQWLGTSYSVWHNRRHELVGHLFQGRYKAQLIEGDTYFWEVSRYIHLNPVRAGLVQYPENWQWSSYTGYWRDQYELPFVNYERILRSYSGETLPRNRQKKLYHAYVHEGVDHEIPNPWKNSWRDFILGSEVFVEKIALRLKRKKETIPDERDVPLLRRLRQRYAAEEVLGAVEIETGISSPALHTQGRGSTRHARNVAMYLCRHLCGMTGRDIGRLFNNISGARVSVCCKKISGEDSLVLRVLQRLEQRERDPAAGG